MKPAYFDHAATTPLDPRVLAEMQPYFSERFGNPASVHRYGQEAHVAVEAARQEVASLLGARPEEVVFTSGGTEANNMAILGVMLAQREQGRTHLMVSAVEHPSVLEPARFWSRRLGLELTVLPVDRYGRVDPEDVRRGLRPTTGLVSVMWANNEVGTLQPIKALARLCQEAGVPLHVDAVQAAGYVAIDLSRVPVALLSLSGHKLYGPKGIGALVVRQGTPFAPLLHGGGQEHGWRSGTLNVPGIVGLAAALRLARQEQQARIAHVRPLRDRLLQELPERIPDLLVTGHPTERLPNHASFVVPGVRAQTLLALLDAAGFACSSGSACKVGTPQPSHVLLAMGYDRDQALAGLRITLGRDNTVEEIEAFLDALPQAVAQARRVP